MERSKAWVFGLVGKKLRAELEDAKEQLPERWTDLIRKLGGRERQKSSDSPAEPSRQSDKNEASRMSVSASNHGSDKSRSVGL